VECAARDAFHPTRTIAPRRPLERPAPDFARARLGRRGARDQHLFTTHGPLRARAGQAPVHASRCRRERDSLGLGAACRLLQPENDARAHPIERSILAREWGFGPRCLPAPTDAGCVGPAARHRVARPASHDQHGVRVHAVTHSRGPRWAWASAPEQRRVPCRERRWAALLAAPRAPGSPASGGRRVGARMRAACRSRLIAGAVSRKAGVRGRIEVPSSVPKSTVTLEGSLLRADRDRAPLTPPPWRHCSGGRAPFEPCQRRLALTSQAVETARPAGRREPKPPRPDDAQRP